MKFLENTTGRKPISKTTFRFHKCKKHLFFKYIAYDSKFNSYSDKYNDNLYDADVCELFIRYGKENHYYEIEVAPNGATFLADIENINDNFKGTLIDECFVKTSSKIKKNKYIVKIIVPREYIKTEKIEFNAYRIETNGGIGERQLLALHPTLCGTFHKNKFIY